MDLYWYFEGQASHVDDTLIFYKNELIFKIVA